MKQARKAGGTYLFSIAHASIHVWCLVLLRRIIMFPVRVIHKSFIICIYLWHRDEGEVGVYAIIPDTRVYTFIRFVMFKKTYLFDGRVTLHHMQPCNNPTKASTPSIEYESVVLV